jgi:hypothetical protein
MARGQMSDCASIAGTFCLLPDDMRENFGCRVCSALARWKHMHYTHVLVREAESGTGAIIFPARLHEMRPVDLQGCILQISLNQDVAELRASLNAAVLVAERTWLWHDQGGQDSYLELKRPKSSAAGA